MASWVFCNCCFQQPRSGSSFSLTSCGHVYCDACLGKGKKNECLICKAPCHTVLLSKHADSDIQALFMRIDDLCKKYSQETSQVSEFQEKHRKRLLAFYKEKISQLEESFRESVLQKEQLQSMRLSQQAAFSTIRNSVSAKPNGYLLLPPNPSAPDRVESMEVDLTPSPVRKPEMAAGPVRISMISPPQDGRMGSTSCPAPPHNVRASHGERVRPDSRACPLIRPPPPLSAVVPMTASQGFPLPTVPSAGRISYPGLPQLSLTPSQASVATALRVPPLQMPIKGPSSAPAPRLPGRAGQGSSPGLGSSPAPPPRQPISISGLLQRHCPGPAPLGVAHRR